MHARTTIILSFAAALVAGCSHNGGKPATTQPTAKSTSSETWTAVATNTNVATDNLTGDWQLAAPRQQVQQASIAATDGERVKIEAGDVLSGDYVKQGDFLLILTSDPRLQSLAWKINSEDSLTVVRSPSIGDVNFTGFTLVRAPADSTASTSSETDSTASNSSASESSVSDETASNATSSESDDSGWSASSIKEAQTDGGEAYEQ